ncbi:MAG: DNA/RNA non-specific endonuclease [Bacteroidota bacterium]
MIMILLFLVIAIMVFSSQTNTGSESSIEKEKNIRISKLDQPCSDNKYTIINHTFFSLAYDESSEQALWVSYTLTDEMTNKNADRDDCTFKTDPLLSTGVNPSDYAKSGYDRGHLCPAADMSFDIQALTETFYMSNMSPQEPGFNRGIWKKLEETVRSWATRDNEIIIASGGSLKYTKGTIGNKHKISIPTYFYKVILDYQEPEIKAIAFVLRNESSSMPLHTFAVSVDSVEKMTGIDFFCNLPDEIEKRLEAACTIKQWFK